MNPHRPANPRLFWLFGALCAVPPICFLASIPWLKQQSHELVFLITGITAAVVILSSVAFAILQDRQLDEWQRSNARFSSQWGWTIGASLVALLLALQPVQELIMAGAAIWGEQPNPDRRLVITTFAFGFMSVVAAQGICTALLSFGWTFWKSRAPRDAS